MGSSRSAKIRIVLKYGIAFLVYPGVFIRPLRDLQSVDYEDDDDEGAGRIVFRDGCVEPLSEGQLEVVTRLFDAGDDGEDGEDTPDLPRPVIDDPKLEWMEGAIGGIDLRGLHPPVRRAPAPLKVVPSGEDNETE